MIFNMVGSSGGSNIELISLTATENDTYTPSSGQAYNEVIVNVPVIPNNYILKNYNVAPNATIVKGDFVQYGKIYVSVSGGATELNCVFPFGYSRGGANTAVFIGIAKDNGTAGAYTEESQATVFIDCYMTPNVT